jgi:hypothetical protein
MKQQSQSSSSPSPKDGKDSTHSKELQVLSSTQLQRLNGLISKGQRAVIGVDPKEAYEFGVSLSKGLKVKKGEVRLMLAAELTRLVNQVGATRTIQTEADIHDAVDDICEVFPSMKIEEILTAFKYIRRGVYELYGNFTINTLIDCIRKYEMNNTVTFREQEHYERKNTINTASLDVKRLMDDLNRDGKLRNPRKLLDRKYIPYPNDTTDDQTPSTQQHKEETQEEARPETNEARTEGEA